MTSSTELLLRDLVAEQAAQRSAIDELSAEVGYVRAMLDELLTITRTLADESR